jgi:PAS domain S-box-containing protein
MSRPSELSNNTYYQHLLKVVGKTASFLPFLVVGLGILVKFGILDNRFYAGDWAFFGVAVGLTICASVNYYYVFIRKSPPLNVYLTLAITYHAFGVLFLLFVSGVFSPFLFGWIIMAVAIDLYFGMTATLLSIATLCITCLISFVLYPGVTPQEQLGLFSSVILITVTCITLSRLRDINDQERIALAQSGDQASIQRERLIALVNSMGDAVITTDETGAIKVYNAATLSLLDTNINLLEKNIDEVLKMKDSHNADVSVMAEATKQHRVFSRNDLVHTFEDGESMNVYINVAPVQPGYHTAGERGFIFILRDITKEKSLEEERDEFISVVSHELRTPIAIAEGTISNLMILQDRGAAKNVMADAVKAAHDQVLFLAKLVNDLSTLSRAERGVGAEIEVVDTTTLLQDIYKEYEPRAAAKQLRLDLNIPTPLPRLKTSKLYLEEILQNFITNALKYTREGSVSISAAMHSHELRISVIDSGIGISKYDQKRIFQKFYRSEDYRTRETSGTGLGLYVCKKLAEKLHASITFESRLNHGSTFTIVIPKNQITTDAVAVKPAPPVGYVPTK